MARLKTYRGAALSQISFPLGGIGSGCVGLAGDGRLVDWEIYNKPAKGSRNGHSHFAVRAMKPAPAKNGKADKSAPRRVLDARVLNVEARPPYTGTFAGDGKEFHRSFGYGIPSETMPGFPNFRQGSFTGEFPFAEMTFDDPNFPGRVRLTAFNPFIPGNEDESSLPAAFFEIEFENTGDAPLDYEAAFCLRNPRKHSRNTIVERDGRQMIRLDPDPAHPVDDILRRGGLCLAVAGGDETCLCENIPQGQWMGDIDVYWHDFAAGLPIRSAHRPSGNFDHAVAAARLRVAPGRRGRARFLLAWHYPRTRNDLEKGELVVGGAKTLAKSWRNYYAVLWEDAPAVAAHALANWGRLRDASELFRRAFHSASVPRAALEAASANLSILKSPTVLRLEDGSLWGWEGVQPDAGSCYGTCQHVWSYAYALPFLFPRLQRSIHDLSYRHNVLPNGGLVFRLLLPVGAKLKRPFRPAADGQFAEAVCVHREWKISGDDAWLRSLWPKLKRTIEYAWSPDNPDRWDPDRAGLLTGRQHHTLDIELFGPNAWLSGLYQAALAAAAEMAEALGEADAAKEYRAIFRRGRRALAKTLFNGRWFIQKIDIRDKGVLARVPDDKDDPFYPGGTNASYWLEEYGEIKAQIGEGCGIDQCLAQWHANLCGLGEIFEPRQLKTALASVFRHNFIRRMGDFANSWRVFALNDEAGVVICTWPKKDTRPTVPVYYHSECMYGFEYAVAALMIQSGMEAEGREIVEKGRDRFDGVKRNPWNEFECGSNYARSMASYSLLHAYSGFRFDARRGMLGFAPVLPGDGRAFWSLDGAWGDFTWRADRLRLRVLHGESRVAELVFADRSFPFAPAKFLKAGQSLTIRL